MQELIAPNVVLFFDREWHEVGDRTHLSEELSIVTGIDQQALFGPEYAMGHPLARRMSWAAHRSTTREEDIAYCLMGLFGVNMPLLYGESSRAFTRLQHEIVKVYGELSLLAWQPWQVSQCRLLLAPSPYGFRGRGNFYPVPDLHLYEDFELSSRGLKCTLRRDVDDMGTSSIMLGSYRKSRQQMEEEGPQMGTRLPWEAVGLQLHQVNHPSQVSDSGSIPRRGIFEVVRPIDISYDTRDERKSWRPETMPEDVLLLMSGVNHTVLVRMATDLEVSDFSYEVAWKKGDLRYWLCTRSHTETEVSNIHFRNTDTQESQWLHVQSGKLNGLLTNWYNEMNLPRSSWTSVSGNVIMKVEASTARVAQDQAPGIRTTASAWIVDITKTTELIERSATNTAISEDIGQ